MLPIIDPISPEDLQSELTPDKLLRLSNKGGNEIYVVTAHNSPKVMQEIGRLREEAFRAAGGGTGQEVDIDEFDTMTSPCKQLIVWSPTDQKIIGGYRFILGEDVKLQEGIPKIATSHLFNFSEKFIKDYLPNTLELGRSFVTLEYQSSRNPKALFALDNLWDGLGALTVEFPQIRYLFGKVTMYPRFGTEGRDLILGFLKMHFPDPDRLITPIHPLPLDSDTNHIKNFFKHDSYKENYKILISELREKGRKIPPLVNAYMGLSPTMRVFGTAINDEFGNVEETGILLTIEDIFEEKKKRHIGTYNKRPIN